MEKIERISRRGQAVKDHEAYVKESRSNWDYVDETRLGEIILAMNEEEAARLPKHSRKLYQELQAEKTVQQEAGEQGFAQQELAQEQAAHRKWLQQQLQPVGVKAAEQDAVMEAANAAYERMLTEDTLGGINDVKDGLDFGIKEHLAFSYDINKIGKQITKRGWSEESIQETLDKPEKMIETRDRRWLPGANEPLDDPATAYLSADGSYVVRNDRTGAIVQISDRNDKNWKNPWDNSGR